MRIVWATLLVGTICGVCSGAASGADWPDLSQPADAVGGGQRDAAVVVGVERYAFVTAVPGAQLNAKEWYAYLTETRGVPPQNVKLLTDEDGAKEQILDAARAAAARAGAGGTLWFVFVGHGAPAADGKDGLLVGMDARQTAESLQQRSVKRGEVLKILGTSKASAISVVIDACFSGRGQDGAAIASGLQPLVTVAGAGATDPRMAVLTAAKGDQFAGALPGANRPAFSYLVLGGLRGWAADKNGKITAGSLWRYATDALEATLRGRKQEPDIMGPQGMVLGVSSGEKGPSLAKLAVATAGGESREVPKPVAVPRTRTTVEGTVAVVNGAAILLSEYRKEFATAMDYWTKTNPAKMADPANLAKLKESTLEQLIDRELLNQEGAKMRLKIREREITNAIDDIKARFKKDDSGNAFSDAEAEAVFAQQLKNEGLDLGKFRERLTRQLMARKVIDEAVKAKMVSPTDAEIRAYFAKIERHIESKKTVAPADMDEDEGKALLEVADQIKALNSERVRVQRVLIRLPPGASDKEKKRARQTAETAKKRLDGGEDFAVVAKDLSEDPESAARGGDLGYVLRGVAPPALEKAAFALGVGDTSGLIYTESGFNIIRVTEKRGAEKPEYEKFRDELANFLGGAAFQKKVEAFVKSLRDKASIERDLPATL